MPHTAARPAEEGPPRKVIEENGCVRASNRARGASESLPSTRDPGVGSSRTRFRLHPPTPLLHMRAASTPFARSAIHPARPLSPSCQHSRHLPAIAGQSDRARATANRAAAAGVHVYETASDALSWHLKGTRGRGMPCDLYRR
ncbi:hypothetical protein MTO96_013116 [Rhipicephalus appendiculatus]